MTPRTQHVLLLAKKLLLLSCSSDVSIFHVPSWEKIDLPVLPSLSVLYVYPKSESSSRAYTLTTHPDRRLGKGSRSHGNHVLPRGCRFVLLPFYLPWALMQFPLATVISSVFAALQEDLPVARLPEICWLVIFILLFGVSLLLYIYIHRAKEHPIIARMWFVFAVGQACGVLSVTCALVGKGDLQTPASLFDAFWSTCVTFALHSASCHTVCRVSFTDRLGVVQSTIPDPHPNNPLSGSGPFKRGADPRVLVRPPRPGNSGPLRPLRLADTPSTEDFCTLQDPFAPSSSQVTEKPFPLFEAARKKNISVLLAPTRHSSPADLRQPPILMQPLEDDTAPLSPPSIALVREPKHASISGAF